MRNESYYKYWGKASKEDNSYHLLPYHCLDVAAVAEVWLETCASLRGNFVTAFHDEPIQERLRAWVLFFVAMHDLGKFDIRFQLKAPGALALAWRRLKKSDHGIAEAEIRKFDHGHAGLAWARREYSNWTGCAEPKLTAWEQWCPWLTAVTGHHGDFPEPIMQGLQLDTDELLIEHDREARSSFVKILELLFLIPAGLSLKDSPPTCSITARTLIAGFCSVCDWIGSNTDFFNYREQPPSTDLHDYYKDRQKLIKSKKLLTYFGLVAKAHGYAGVVTLLRNDEKPRGIQTVIDELPVEAGLTLIEAPTGSGKTEAALAYAWRMLDAGVADSIVFALPTQATANAMLERVEAFAAHVFGSSNVVLAHGKRQYNENFQKFTESGRRVTAQGKIEAAVQCATWLASSRKRVFLGQIGVCTVDQVLLSVLPVRHKFVRGYGLAKSVLIIDEVHAYDAYMHGLLGEVLRQQKDCGGSAMLLSATLPANLRAKLLLTWGASGPDEAPYPAVWNTTGGEVRPLTVVQDQRPTPRTVEIECLKVTHAFPDANLIVRIISAAEAGAQVAIIVNLVDDAQRLARLLSDQSNVEIDIFHARFRFTDRKEKERACINHFGRNAPRQSGRILVATQVVEQSLDLDFDWMISQICPVDLLFQRLGRLHRHLRDHRPIGFESPCCTVLSVDGDDYGLHSYIYGNTRVLWRTEKLLSSKEICFPEAYRDWIEIVYSSTATDDEPDPVYGDYLAWRKAQSEREVFAKSLTTMTVKNFRDDEVSLSGLTRDGEMSLNVLPVLADACLLDGNNLSELLERNQAEALDLNAIPVPASWKKLLSDCTFDKEGPLAGYWQLTMKPTNDGHWTSANGKFSYSHDYGLEKSAQ